MRFSQLTHLLMCFPLEALMSINLTYSGGTHRSEKLCYNCSISNDFTQMVKFPAHIPDCDSHSSALFDLFFLNRWYLFYNVFPCIGKF